MEMEQLFERSKELPLFILYSLDLLLIHSFRAMTKTVNMFKTAARRRLGIVDSGNPSNRHRSCSRAGSRDDGNNEGSGHYLHVTYLLLTRLFVLTMLTSLDIGVIRIFLVK